MKVAIILTFLLTGFIVGYFVHPLVQPKLGSDSSISSLLDTYQIDTPRKLPECYAGRCPEYFSMDVDGDDLSESLAIIPTAMTQGAGKLWIIDNGKVIFETPEIMRIGVRQSPEEAEAGNRFSLFHAKEVNSNNLTEIKYLYQDGQFKVVPL